MPRAGGLAVLLKYGSEHLREISSLPPNPGKLPRGRPTRQAAAERAWAILEERRLKTARRRR